MNAILKRAFLNAIATTAYVFLVVGFITSLRYLVSQEGSPIIPIAMLLLLVCSAAITSFLIFGKPVMLYLDGKKKDALSLLTHTLAMLVLITIVIFAFLIFYLR